MSYFLILRLFSRKSKLNVDRANEACTGYRPSTLNHMTAFLWPIVADFCAHLFSKGVSFCFAVGTFAAYPFVSLRNFSF